MYFYSTYWSKNDGLRNVWDNMNVLERVCPCEPVDGCGELQNKRPVLWCVRRMSLFGLHHHPKSYSPTVSQHRQPHPLMFTLRSAALSCYSQLSSPSIGFVPLGGISSKPVVHNLDNLTWSVTPEQEERTEFMFVWLNLFIKCAHYFHLL